MYIYIYIYTYIYIHIYIYIYLSASIVSTSSTLSLRSLHVFSTWRSGSMDRVVIAKERGVVIVFGVEVVLAVVDVYTRIETGRITKKRGLQDC